jgi:hypothetical protein
VRKRGYITKACWVRLKGSGKKLYVDSWTAPDKFGPKEQEVYFRGGGWAFAHEVEILPLSKLEKVLK